MIMTRKAIERVLIRSGLEPQRFKVEMELSSIEAIKNAEQQ